MDASPRRAPAVLVRSARPTDLPELVALLDRCSPETRYRRFHGASGHVARHELERIAAPTPAHRSWVAVDASGRIVGTSTLAWGRDGRAEVAFLVDDARRREGIGRRLVDAVRSEAERCQQPVVDARIQGENVGARRFLQAVAPGVVTRFEDGGTVATIPIPTPAARAHVPATAIRPGPGPRTADRTHPHGRTHPNRPEAA